LQNIYLSSQYRIPFIADPPHLTNTYSYIYLLFPPTGILFPHGVVLYGPPGVGKTLLAGALAHESSAGTDMCTAADDDVHVHTVQLSANELLLGGQEEGREGRMKEVFKEARDRSVLVYRARPFLMLVLYTCTYIVHCILVQVLA
jgi:hypothetical protein